MTPEALFAYLVQRRVDEDIIQEVMVRYLRASEPPRNPKAWALKVAWRIRLDRKTKGPGVRMGITTISLPDTLQSPQASPLKVAEDRERLRRVFAQPANPYCRYWADYRALLQSQR